MDKKKLAYISNSVVPSFQANSFHVINMVFELNKYFDVTLFSYNGRRKKLKEFYGLDILFKIKFFKLSPAPVFNFFTMMLFPLINFYKFDFFLGRNVKILCFLFLFKKKVILELHQPIYRHTFLEKLLLFRVIKKGITLVVISKKLKQIIQQEVNLSKSNINVFPDASRSFYQKKSIKQDCIGYFGSLLPGRGLEIIFLLAKELPQVKFNIFGKSNYYFDSFFKKHKTNNIIYNKFISHTEIGKLMSEQFILVAPYQKNTSIPGGAITSEWMSPLKIFEYMSSRRPIISSDLPVLKEVLIHRKNCLLVKPGNVTDWVRAIKLLKSNSKLMNYIIGNAYKDFKKKFSWEVRVKNYVQLLRRMDKP